MVDPGDYFRPLLEAYGPAVRQGQRRTGQPEDRPYLNQHPGQDLTKGPPAKAHANNFIVHLSEMPYSTIGARGHYLPFGPGWAGSDRSKMGAE